MIIIAIILLLTLATVMIWDITTESRGGRK